MSPPGIASRVAAWLGRGRRSVELRAKPAVRREKSYAADSGYVYQYTYEGYREASADGVDGHEFVFECTADRAARFLIRLFAPQAAFAEWERGAGVELTERERYAVIKMRLFEIFDETPLVNAPLADTLTAEQVRRHVEALGLFEDADRTMGA